jgi:hypothetical protein
MAIPTVAESAADAIKKVRGLMGPVTATYGGNDYVVGKGMDRRQTMYDEQGKVVEVDFSLLFVKSELDANDDDPQPNQAVTIDGASYRIKARSVDPFGAGLKLGLEQAF